MNDALARGDFRTPLVIGDRLDTDIEGANAAGLPSLMVLTGVTGPLLDRHFLGGGFDRREIVATKAACQTVGHSLKLVYFGVMVVNTGQVDPWLGAMAVIASMTGTMLAKRVLEAMTDASYRLWAGRIVTVLGLFYIGQGSWLLLTE